MKPINLDIDLSSNWGQLRNIKVSTQLVGHCPVYGDVMGNSTQWLDYKLLGFKPYNHICFWLDIEVSLDFGMAWQGQD
jgi:hypothetical protein